MNPRFASTISLLLGAMIVMVVGILIFNYFNREKNNSEEANYKICHIGYGGNCYWALGYEEKDGCVNMLVDEKPFKLCGNYSILKLR